MPFGDLLDRYGREVSSGKKLHVLDLARMVGHRDIKQLQSYYNATAEEIAKLLD